MTNRNKFLASVSAIALTAVMGAGGAKANDLSFDLGTVEVVAGASSHAIANEQMNEADVLATAAIIQVGLPTTPGQTHNYAYGEGNNLIVDVEDIFAVATGNLTPLTAVDFELVTGTAGANYGAIAGNIQINNGNLADGDITGSITGASVQVDATNLGPTGATIGNSVDVNENLIRSDVAGNDATVRVAGDISGGLVNSTELGTATLSASASPVVASAVALAGSYQANVDNALLASVAGSRVGALVENIGELTQIGIDVLDNAITADIVGNTAVVDVSLTNGVSLQLNGAAGVANAQVNGAGTTITAQISDSTVEIGDTVNYGTPQHITYLTRGSVTLEGNSIEAAATSNQAANKVSLADGINQTGVTTAGAQENTFSTLTDSSTVTADLFIANGQVSNAAVLAQVDGGQFNVLVEDAVFSSSITADKNTLGASANGSAVVNTLEVGDATTFDSVIGVNSVQYNEGSQVADVDGGIKVDAGVPGSQSYGFVGASNVSVDDNTIYGDAIGNSHSTAIAVDAGTFTGAGVTNDQTITSNRDTQTGGIRADTSLLSVQVLDGAVVQSTVDTTIAVTSGTQTFTASDLSVSDNAIRGQVIGNLSTEASVDIAAQSFAATAGVVNSQTVEDGTLLSSVVTADGQAFIDVDVPLTYEPDTNDTVITGSSIDVNGNKFTSQVWANLADSTTNSLTVSGGSASDNGYVLPGTTVDRSGIESNTTVNAGLALLNDQSVEDLGASVVTAQTDGVLVNVLVGQNDTEVFNSTNVSASQNAATTSAVLNQATSAVGIDVTSLNASSALVNVQSVIDTTGAGSAAAVDVSQNNLDIIIDLLAQETIDNVTVDMDGNSTLASARLNQAANTVNIKAGSQVIGGAIDEGANDDSVLLGGVTTANGEAVLVNDQTFADLAAGGVLVSVLDNDFTVDVGADEAISNSNFSLDKNSITGYLSGNDASNRLAYDVTSVDLNTADDGAPGNGPIASIVSNQTGTSGGQGVGALAVNVADSTIALDLNTPSGNDVTDVDNVNASLNQNTIRSFARANNVVNALTASGNNLTLPAAGGETRADVDTGETDQIQLDATTFAVASRQVNSVGVAASTVGSTVSADVLLTDDGLITDTDISVNSNVVVSEARGSDAANSAALDYKATNEAQAYVANLQYADAPVSYSALTAGTEISILLAGDVEESNFTVSGNGVAAIASANTAANVLTSAGNNVSLAAGDDDAEFDGSDGSLFTDAALAVINVQGASDVANGPGVDVTATVGGTLIGVIAGMSPLNENFDDGAISVENNLVLAQASMHTATNALNITGEANVRSDGADNDIGAAVLSLQTISLGSDVIATVDTAVIGGGADNTSADSSFAARVSGNEVTASAIGGAVTNALSVTAGANIDAGNNNSPEIANFGDDDVNLDSSFNVLNVQQALGANFSASVTNVGIVAATAEDLNADSLRVENNEVNAVAQGFTALNSLNLKAGAGIEAPGMVANTQTIIGEGNDISASISGAAIAALNEDEGAINSSLSVAGNALNASAGGNQAANTLVASAGAAFEGVALGGVLNVDADGNLNSTDFDYAVLNRQAVDGMEISASISTVGIGVDGFEATTGLQGVSASVSGNEVLASATGNEAVNQLVLNSGTYTHASGAIGNMQTNNGTSISASISGVAIGVGGTLSTINANSNGNSLAVRGNSIGATAIGNSAVNVLRSGN
ncbi:beta strand repeat-containing protein [Mycolicibacterium sp.]|uniref:beta strand repeat-containing protein n=1 Tax=Mycolicibacterium sp. TaxID=2320850 RepID=UPI00355CBBEC